MKVNEKYNLVGKKFGNLTVIKNLNSVNIRGERLWECQCSCGTVLIKPTGILKSSTCKNNCGCIPKKRNKNSNHFINMVGKKFGRLTPISYEKYRWVCLCDCGKKTIVDGKQLRFGLIKSCGCLLEEHLKIHQSTNIILTTKIMRNYIFQAKHRKLEFDLTFDDFNKLILGNCHYCNEPPSNKRIRKNRLKNEFILFNGIDRKNNLKGYTFENSVSCCEICNRAKNNLSYEDFLMYISRFK